GYSALHVASYFGSYKVAQLLMDFGAKKNGLTNREYSPMDCVAQRGHWPIVKLLLDNDASPDIENYDGETPLAMAEHLGFIDIVNELNVVTENTKKSKIYRVTEDQYKIKDKFTELQTQSKESQPPTQFPPQQLLSDAELNNLRVISAQMYLDKPETMSTYVKIDSDDESPDEDERMNGTHHELNEERKKVFI
ncbi:hypothetical protein SNEBB_004013, partial [Seison nebaliae]